MKSIKIEYPDWVEYRNKEGHPHRTDGPARDWKSGTKEWFINGQCHREDGPAVEFSDGEKWWYLNGQKFYKEEWEQEVAKIKLKRILDL